MNSAGSKERSTSFSRVTSPKTGISISSSCGGSGGGGGGGSSSSNSISSSSSSSSSMSQATHADRVGFS